MPVQILRGRDTLTQQLEINDAGQLGIVTYGMNHFFETERREFTLLSAIPAGIYEGWDFLVNIYILSMPE